jgi:hypothetical protein
MTLLSGALFLMYPPSISALYGSSARSGACAPFAWQLLMAQFEANIGTRSLEKLTFLVIAVGASGTYKVSSFTHPDKETTIINSIAFTSLFMFIFFNMTLLILSLEPRGNQPPRHSKLMYYFLNRSISPGLIACSLSAPLNMTPIPNG